MAGRLTGEDVVELGRAGYERFMNGQMEIAHLAVQTIIDDGGRTDDVDLFVSTFLPYSPEIIIAGTPERAAGRGKEVPYVKSRLRRAQQSLGLVAVEVLSGQRSSPNYAGIVRRRPEPRPTDLSMTGVSSSFPVGEYFAMRVSRETKEESPHRNGSPSSWAGLFVVDPVTRRAGTLTVIEASRELQFGDYNPANGKRVLIGMDEISASPLKDPWKAKFAQWTEQEGSRLREERDHA